MLRPTRRFSMLFAVLCVWGLASCANLLVPGIVGTWQSDANSANTIEFFPDGTLRETAPLKTSNGKYVLLDGSRVKMEIDGVLWGTNVIVWKYAVDGNKLTMATEGGVAMTLTWTRVNK